MGPKEELAENVLGLFKSSEYSDLTIALRNKTFEVHKALICPRSEYFRKACKDGTWKEGQNKAINMQDDQDIPVPMDDPVLVEYMLQYLYGLDYMEEPGEYELGKPEEDGLSKWGKKKGSKLQSRRRERLEAQPWPEDPFVPYEEGTMASELESDCSKGVSCGDNAAVHAQMCAIADFYGIPDLQKVARRKFRVALNKIHDNQGIVKVFKLVCDPDFRSDVVLRDIMVGKIATDNKLLDEQEVEEILQKDGELALAIAKHMR